MQCMLGTASAGLGQAGQGRPVALPQAWQRLQGARLAYHGNLLPWPRPDAHVSGGSHHVQLVAMQARPVLRSGQGRGRTAGANGGAPQLLQLRGCAAWAGKLQGGASSARAARQPGALCTHWERRAAGWRGARLVVLHGQGHVPVAPGQRARVGGDAAEHGDAMPGVLLLVSQALPCQAQGCFNGLLQRAASTRQQAS